MTKLAQLTGTRNGKEINMEVEVKFHPHQPTAWIKKPGGKKFFGTTGYHTLDSDVITTYRHKILVENVNLEIKE